MIVFNLLGATFLMVSALLTFLMAAAASRGWGISIDPESPLLLFMAGNLAAGFDIAYRGFRGRGSVFSRFAAPNGGGHLFFVPVWIWGLLMLSTGVFSCATADADRNARSAQNDVFVEKTVATLEDNAVSFGREQARQATHRVVMQQLSDFYVKLDNAEKAQIDLKYGDRIARVLKLIEHP
jgi:hypothetical protein